MCETPSNQNVEEWLVEEGGFSHQYAYEVSQNITDNELRAGVCNILEGELAVFFRCFKTDTALLPTIQTWF